MPERILGNRFKLQAQLSKNHEVWKATDLDSKKDSIVKIIAMQSSKSARWTQFESELEVISKINHPGILKILDWGECDGGNYVAFESFQGTPLSEIKPTSNLVIEILTSLTKIIEILIGNDITHRDLRSENIILIDSSPAQVKIVDFGSISSDKTRLKQMKTSDIINTISWMPPEVLRNDSRSAKSNFYNLGIIAYSLLTGDLPFHDRNPSNLVWQIQNAIPAPVSMFNPRVPMTLENLVKRLLRKDPQSRPGSTNEVLDSLNEAKKELESSGSISTASGLFLNKGTFIGRGTELECIKNALAKDQFQIIVISGEHGMGKTRMLQEIGGISRTFDWPVLSTFCEIQKHKKPLSVCCQLIDEAVLEIGLSTVGKSPYKNEFVAICPELATRLLMNPETIEQQQQELSKTLPKAFVWLIEQFSRRSKTVIIIDDFQWCDIESMNIILSSIADLSKMPITLVFSTQSQQGGFDNNPVDILESPDLVNILMKPLTPKECKLLAQDVIGMSEIPMEILDLIIMVSKGNPTLLLQTIAGLASHNYINASGLLRPIDEGDIPRGFEALAKWRIEVLPEKVKKILEVAAIIGESFDEQMLLFLTPESEADTQEALDYAIMAMLIALNKTTSGYRYQFTHSSIKDCLIMALNQKQALTLHDKVAKAMLRFSKNNKDINLTELIDHVIKGNNPQKAIPYLIEASFDAENNFKIANAYDFAKQAFDLSIKSADVVLEVKTTIRLVEILLFQNKITEAYNICNGILCALRKIGLDTNSESDLLYTLAIIAIEQGNCNDAESLIQAAHNIVGRFCDDAKIARLHLAESMCLEYQDVKASLVHSKKAFELIKNQDDIGITCSVLTQLARSYLLNGLIEDARMQAGRALELVSKIGSLKHKAMVLIVLSEIEYQVGDCILGQEYLQIAKEISHKMNSPILLAHTILIDAATRSGHEDTDSVKHLTERSIDIFTQTDSKNNLKKALLLMCIYNIEEKDTEGARYYLVRYKDIYSDNLSHFQDLELLIVEAQIQVLENRLEIARMLISKALSLGDAQSVQWNLKAHLTQVIIDVKEEKFKEALTRLKDLPQRFPELATTPSNKCEIGLIASELWLRILYQLPKKSKAQRILQLSRMGLTGIDPIEVATKNIDTVYIDSLSSCNKTHPIKSALANSKLQSIIATYEPEKATTHYQEAIKFGNIAKQLAQELHYAPLIIESNAMLTKFEKGEPFDPT